MRRDDFKIECSECAYWEVIFQEGVIFDMGHCTCIASDHLDTIVPDRHVCPHFDQTYDHWMDVRNDDRLHAVG